MNGAGTASRKLGQTRESTDESYQLGLIGSCREGWVKWHQCWSRIGNTGSVLRVEGPVAFNQAKRHLSLVAGDCTSAENVSAFESVNNNDDENRIDNDIHLDC
jgi:hypothetical protein